MTHSAIRAAPTRAQPSELSGASGVAAAAALVAVMFMGSTLLTPLYALYRKSFGFSLIGLTLLYSVYVIGNLTAALLLGRLSDQLGRRRMALAAMALGAASAGIFLLASPVWLFVARILSGVSVGVASGVGAAWIAELTGGKDRAEASRVATVANFLGIAAGPIVAGVLAQYAPAPLQLPFVAYLVLLAGVALAIGRTRETVQPQAGRRLDLRPRLGVPAELRAAFVAPAVSVFGTMALVGFYAALMPTLLIEVTHETNLAIGGAVSAAMFLFAAAAVVASQRIKPRTAMLSGLILMAPSVALLVAAQWARSLPLMLGGAAATGVAAALSYRGSLQVVNGLAPPDRRAELTSTYYLFGFAGNALPVIGVGVLTTLYSSLVGSAAFAAAIAIFALAAAALELARKPGGKR